MDIVVFISPTVTFVTMKRFLLLLLLITSFGLYSQEFDDTYKITYVGAEGDGIGAMSPVKVKWFAVIKGDTVTIYDSKKLNDVIETYVIGTSTKGDLRLRVVLNAPTEDGDEYNLVITSVDDFTKRVSNLVYLMKKQG